MQNWNILKQQAQSLHKYCKNFKSWKKKKCVLLIV